MTIEFSGIVCFPDLTEVVSHSTIMHVAAFYKTTAVHRLSSACVLASFLVPWRKLYYEPGFTIHQIS